MPRRQLSSTKAAGKPNELVQTLLLEGSSSKPKPSSSSNFFAEVDQAFEELDYVSPFDASPQTTTPKPSAKPSAPSSDRFLFTPHQVPKSPAPVIKPGRNQLPPVVNSPTFATPKASSRTPFTFRNLTPVVIQPTVQYQPTLPIKATEKSLQTGTPCLTSTPNATVSSPDVISQPASIQNEVSSHLFSPRLTSTPNDTASSPDVISQPASIQNEVSSHLFSPRLTSTPNATASSPDVISQPASIQNEVSSHLFSPRLTSTPNATASSPDVFLQSSSIQAENHALSPSLSLSPLRTPQSTGPLQSPKSNILDNSFVETIDEEEEVINNIDNHEEEVEDTEVDLELQEEEVVKKQSPSKTRRSKVIEPIEEGNLRRSSRKRVKPLRWWKNERPVYDHQGSLLTLSEPSFVTPEKKRPQSKTRKRTSASVKDKKPEPKTKKNNPQKPSEVKFSRLGTAPEDIDWTTIALADDDERKQVMVGKASEGRLPYANFKTGIFKISALGVKKREFSSDFVIILFLSKGTIALDVNDERFELTEGSSYNIPPRSEYSMENLTRNECLVNYTLILPND
ncbi:hypothetical protein GEMRC1_013541 [Eukaryota sp. GEM-RC1]